MILLTSLMQILVCFARDRVSIIINSSSNSNDICGKVDDISCAIICTYICTYILADVNNCNQII